MPYSIDEIKKMSIKELSSVAAQLRTILIDNLKSTGGHLSSNLGMVELTIALHYVFNSPRDKFFFDVSHQTYVHKILTNRLDRFHTLRKFHGLSGFSSKTESIHDVFEAGHSSTSISAALGYLEAKEDNPKLCDEVIAIIGDASIVNGLSMEALNYLGSKPHQKMIIILNDNEMGISKNIGGLAKTFNNIRVKGHFKLLRKILPRSFKMMMKSIAYKNNIFSSMGLKYLGIIDGHNIKELIECFKYAKRCPSSIVLHVKTVKGKGFIYAEEDKTGVWHSTPAFDPITGIQENGTSNYLFGNALSKKISSLVEENPNIRVITPGMGYGSGIDTFQLTHPQKYIDVGIAEENAIMMASSMSEAGLIPIVFIYSTFLQRAYDELVHDLARNKNHVIICVDRAGIVDGDGPTHQGIFDIAYLSTIPNISIFSPMNIVEAYEILDYAIKNEGCFVIRYPKVANSYGIGRNTNILKWDIIKESKNNKYIISYGPNIDNLNEKLIKSQTGLINARIIKPFDDELLIKLVKQNAKLFFYEEVCQNNSLGSQVLNYLHEEYEKNSLPMYHIKITSLPNCYLEVGTKEELKNEYGLNLEKFIQMVEEN